MERSAGFSKDITEGRPGELGWKVLTASGPAEKTKKLSAEIANGCLAMTAIICVFFQDGLAGSPWGDWALYTASVCGPSRASFASGRQWASGTLWASPLTATTQPSRAAVPLS